MLAEALKLRGQDGIIMRVLRGLFFQTSDAAVNNVTRSIASRLRAFVARQSATDRLPLHAGFRGLGKTPPVGCINNGAASIRLREQRSNSAGNYIGANIKTKMLKMHHNRIPFRKCFTK